MSRIDSGERTRLACWQRRPFLGFVDDATVVEFVADKISRRTFLTANLPFAATRLPERSSMQNRALMIAEVCKGFSMKQRERQQPYPENRLKSVGLIFRPCCV